MRYFHFGEGEYDVSEKVIQQLLQEAGQTVGGIVSKPAPQLEAQTPETYLGYDRARGFASAVPPQADAPVDIPAGPAAAAKWGVEPRRKRGPSRRSTWFPLRIGNAELGFNARTFSWSSSR